MKELIDRAKCSSEDYGLCKRCKHYEGYYEGCTHCTSVVDIGYSFIICGVPVGSGFAYYHENFEERRADHDLGDDIYGDCLINHQG